MFVKNLRVKIESKLVGEKIIISQKIIFFDSIIKQKIATFLKG